MDGYASLKPAEKDAGASVGLECWLNETEAFALQARDMLMPLRSLAHRNCHRHLLHTDEMGSSRALIIGIAGLPGITILFPMSIYDRRLYFLLKRAVLVGMFFILVGAFLESSRDLAETPSVAALK